MASTNFCSPKRRVERIYRVRSNYMIMLSPRQIIIESILTECGIAFGFTLGRLWSNAPRSRKALKTMVRNGFLSEYKCANINMYTLSPYFLYGENAHGHVAKKHLLEKIGKPEDEHGFNHCLVAHFLMLVREREPSHITIWGDNWIWTHKGKHTLLHVDNPRVVAATTDYPSLVICNEIHHVSGNVKMVKREDLLNNELIFYDNNGKIFQNWQHNISMQTA